MRLSFDDFKQYLVAQKQADDLDGFQLDECETLKVRGGDKEYNPPLYEQKHKGFWHQANMLLDNLK